MMMQVLLNKITWLHCDQRDSLLVFLPFIVLSGGERGLISMLSSKESDIPCFQIGWCFSCHVHQTVFAFMFHKHSAIQ